MGPLGAVDAQAGRRGRPHEVDFCEMINAVRHLVRSGCGWRMLQIQFGAWQTVYAWFRTGAQVPVTDVHDIELMLGHKLSWCAAGNRQSVGQGASDTSPSIPIAVADSQPDHRRTVGQRDAVSYAETPIND